MRSADLLALGRPPLAQVDGEDGHRAAALLGGEEQAAAAPKGYLIQLGVFKDAANAQSIVHEAKSAGVGARAETAGTLTRVRAGPFPTREAAEGWRDRVESRNEAWDEADREWEGDDGGSADAGESPAG